MLPLSSCSAGNFLRPKLASAKIIIQSLAEEALPLAYTLSGTHQERAKANGIFEQGTKTKIWLLC